MDTAKVTRLQVLESMTPGQSALPQQWVIVAKEHADHLMKVLKDHYEVAEEWDGTKDCGITLDWDYIKRQVHLSIPGLGGPAQYFDMFNRHPGKVAYMRPQKKALHGD